MVVVLINLTIRRTLALHCLRFSLAALPIPKSGKSAPVESSKFIGRYKKWLLGFALVCRGKILNRDGLNYLPHQEIKLLSGKEFFIFTQTFIMLCIESGN